MRIGKLTYRDYKTVRPYESIESVREKLNQNGFLIVSEKGEYQGILTMPDLSVMGHNLVIDCVREKPALDYNTDLDEAIKLLEENSIHVAPVYNKESFYSVIRYRDILNYLYERNKQTAVHAEKLEKYEALKKLSSGVGHDFNNILTAAIGNLDIISESIQEKPELWKEINRVIDVLISGRMLTDQLLTFSVESSTHKEEYSLDKEVKRLVPFFTKGTGVEPVFRFQEDLWPVMVDKKMFMQVWSNLSLNAVEAMPMGGKIEFSGKNTEIDEENAHGIKPGRYVKISVSDNGPGISEDIKKDVFEPYFTSKLRGNGLGLSIVHSVVNYHNGTITINTERDKGTTFDLLIPTSL
ncbi:MAG: ATP-binding protein [Chitinivibrionales bacterium]